MTAQEATTCRCGTELVLMVALPHGQNVSFCLACIGPTSCGYLSNRIELDNPTPDELASATQTLIASLRQGPDDRREVA